MACATVRDVFDAIRKLHQDVAVFARRADGIAPGERVHLVLAYLARHEQNMAKCMAQYERDAAHKILETPFSKLTTLNMDEVLKKLVLGPQSTAEDVIQLAVSTDACLSHLYQEAVEKAGSDDVRQLFTKLRDHNERETRRMVRDMVEVEDL